MNLPFTAIKDAVVAIAQAELLPRFAKVDRAEKADGSIITEADLATQQRIITTLQTLTPDIALLGEEMTPAQQQALISSGEPIWCLDPLDGTSNFAAGIPYFSVSLALIERGAVRYGLVYDPSRNECFEAWDNTTATLNGAALESAQITLPLKKTIALIDFKRLPATLATRLVVDIPYASQRSFGSVALDWCWLAAGRCHIYLHGKQNIWDYAAGQFIFSQTGGASSTLEGESIFTPELTPRSACGAVTPALFEAWQQYLRGA